MARRHKKHEDHENHERWLVSYADFITLLFAFFVVMYAVSSVNEGKYRVMSDSLVSAFKNVPKTAQPGPVAEDSQSSTTTQNVIRYPVPHRKASPLDAQRKQQEEKLKNIASELMRVMGSLVKEGQVKISQSTRGVAVEINASVLFAPGRAELEENSIGALEAVADVLSDTEYAVQVEGYTDDKPIKSMVYPSNWELSTARSSSVVRLFIENGVKPERLQAVGYAEYRPIQSNDTIEGRARNRRVTILILADSSEANLSAPFTAQQATQ